MAFDPPIWHPLFEFLRNELMPLLSGGGGASVNAEHAFIDALAWEWTQGSEAGASFPGTAHVVVAAYSDDNPNERTFSVALAMPSGSDEYQYVWWGVRGDDAGIAQVYINGVLMDTTDLYDTSPSEGSFSFQFDQTILGDGLVEVKILCDSKNASSSSYRIRVGGFAIYPYQAP